MKISANSTGWLMVMAALTLMAGVPTLCQHDDDQSEANAPPNAGISQQGQETAADLSEKQPSPSLELQLPTKRSLYDIPEVVAEDQDIIFPLEEENVEELGYPEVAVGEASQEEDKRYTPRFVGKRYAPRFVGKRYTPRFVGKRYTPRFVGKRYTPRFVGKRYTPRFVGKRYTPRFVGKRYTPRFVGKRYTPRFVGKRYTPRFVGKRYDPPRFVGKRYTPRFVGKRSAEESVGEKRDAEETNDQMVSEHSIAKRALPPTFVGKRYTPRFVGKRSAEESIDEKRDADETNEQMMPAHSIAKRAIQPRFVGKRNIENLLLSSLESRDADSETGLDDEDVFSDRHIGDLDMEDMVKRGRKRYIPRFVGKRGPPRFVGKRYVPRFVGKREFHDIYDLLESSDEQDLDEKRQAPRFVGKRGPSLQASEENRDYDTIFDLLHNSAKRARSPPRFVGKRRGVDALTRFLRDSSEEVVRRMLSNLSREIAIKELKKSDKRYGRPIIPGQIGKRTVS